MSEHESIKCRKISPARLAGSVCAIGSKSYAHRALICAAFADRPTELVCSTSSEDIEATIDALCSLGARITRDRDRIWVEPIGDIPHDAMIDCRESGSTYRFILPCVLMRGADARFKLGGRLPARPMDAFWRLVEQRGISVSGKGSDIVCVSGKLCGERFTIPGNISSQYISGMAMALGMSGKSGTIEITKDIESLGYINITLDVMRSFGIRTEFEGNKIVVHGEKRYVSSGKLKIEGDWSNAAFWLCAAAAEGGSITVTGLDNASKQGDRAICDILTRFGARLTEESDGVTVEADARSLRAIEVDVHDTPDLVPAIAICAAAAKGETVISGAARLRLKESDRLETVTSTIRTLGGNAVVDGDSIRIRGGKLLGGKLDGKGDHRIVMMAATASVLCSDAVELIGADACEKSYPSFFEDLAALGGRLEPCDERSEK